MLSLRFVRRIALFASWALALGIVFATLGPQGLRPHVGDPQLERFCAYVVTAAAFVVAYPRRWLVVMVGMVATAVLLELGQRFVPGRDPGVADAIAKALGGVFGAVGAHRAIVSWRDWRRSGSIAES